MRDQKLLGSHGGELSQAWRKRENWGDEEAILSQRA